MLHATCAPSREDAALTCRPSGSFTVLALAVFDPSLARKASMVTWSPGPQRFFAPAAAKQRIGAAGFDRPAHHFAVRLLDVQVDPGMWVHEVELDDGAVQRHWLFVIELSCKGMVRPPRAAWMQEEESRRARSPHIHKGPPQGNARKALPLVILT